MQQHLGLARTSGSPGKGQGRRIWSILSLCHPPSGTFEPFLPIKVGQPTLSKALGTLVHSGLGTLLSYPRLKPPSLTTQNAGGQPGVALRHVSGAEQRQDVGKTSYTPSGINSRREILTLGLRKSSIFLSWVFHDWACCYVLGVNGVNCLLKKRRHCSYS